MAKTVPHARQSRGHTAAPVSTEKLDLNELLVFTRVVQAGSFTAAARQLGMPKSTVSRRVTDLEARLGVRLLQRTTRKSGLSDAGRIYFSYAERIVAEAEQAERAVNTLQVVPRGRLRVTAPLSFSLLSPAIALFARRCPEVELELTCTDRTVDLVEEGFDVAVRTGKLLDSSLVSRPLGHFRRVVVASAAHVAASGPLTEPSHLEGHATVAFGVGVAPLTWSLHSTSERVEITVGARLIVNDLELLIEAVCDGLGVALVPEFAVAGHLKSRRLVRVLEAWEGESVPLQAVYPSARLLSPKVAAFVDVLVETLRPSRGAVATRSRA